MIKHYFFLPVFLHLYSQNLEVNQLFKYVVWKLRDSIVAQDSAVKAKQTDISYHAENRLLSQASTTRQQAAKPDVSYHTIDC